MSNAIGAGSRQKKRAIVIDRFGFSFSTHECQFAGTVKPVNRPFLRLNHSIRSFSPAADKAHRNLPPDGSLQALLVVATADTRQSRYDGLK
jgi:hypothetical protein